MYGTPQQRMQRFFFSGGCPATTLIIAANVVGFFSAAILHAANPFLWLIYTNDTWPERFWTVITWPLAGVGDPLSLVFACLWAYWVCGSLERSWGTRTFVTFFVAMSALTALTLWVGGRLLDRQTILVGLWTAVAAPTVAWCTINRREVINIYGILPVPAPLLAWFSVILVWYQNGPPLLGLFALSGCAAAYWYAGQGRYAYHGYTTNNLFGGLRRKAPVLRLDNVERGPEREAVRGGFSPLRWWRARQERRKLEELWRRSNEQDKRDP